MGKLEVFDEGKKIGEYSLVCAKDVKKASLWQMITRKFEEIKGK